MDTEQPFKIFRNKPANMSSNAESKPPIAARWLRVVLCTLQFCSDESNTVAADQLPVGEAVFSVAAKATVDERILENHLQIFNEISIR